MAADLSLLIPRPETRENLLMRESGRNARHGVAKQSKVVGEREAFNAFSVRQRVKKGIVGNDGGGREGTLA